MKVARKVVFLFRDSEGFASAIFDALHPDTHSSLRPLEETLELSLESYGIKDQKASAKILHYVDHQGNFQVSLLLMQNYEPPVLACAVTEVLSQITRGKSSSMPTLILPFVLASSKLKWESKTLTTKESKASVYGIQIGPETDITQAMAIRTQKIVYEIGELLASSSSLCFLRDRIVWQPTNTSKESDEPWRAMYG
uniref:DUF7894 domain-containing protein n=1 Tax=Fagus sylvatica TaxID=28930 RepID=A0A2N9EJK7_FAGSY